jgi:hypothetical protein
MQDLDRMRLAMATSNSPEILSTITDDEIDEFRITIPSSPWSVLRACCYTAIGTAGMVIWALYLSSGMTPKPIDPRVSLLVLFWLLMPAYLLIRALTGRDILIIDGKSLCLKRECAGRCRTQTFDLLEIKNLRPVRGSDVVEGRSRACNAIAFDSGGSSYHFGDGISELEAVRLVKTIRHRFPIKDDLDDAEPLPMRLIGQVICNK